MTQDLYDIPLESRYRILVIIWGAIVLSVGIYAVVAWFVKTGPADGGLTRILVFSLGLASGLILFLQGKLRANLADEHLFPRVLDLESWGLRPQAAVRLKAFPVPERGDHLIMQAHLIFGIIIWALADVVAAFGLVLTLTSGDRRLMGVFGFAALGMLLYFRPDQGSFEKQLTRWRRYVEMNRGTESEVRSQEPGE